MPKKQQFIYIHYNINLFWYLSERVLHAWELMCLWVCCGCTCFLQFILMTNYLKFDTSLNIFLFFFFSSFIFDLIGWNVFFLEGEFRRFGFCWVVVRRIDLNGSLRVDGCSGLMHHKHKWGWKAAAGLYSSL